MSLLEKNPVLALLRASWMVPTEQMRARADAGDADAQYEMGARMCNADRCALNEEEGWRYLIKAAHQGHPVALGLCYRDGKQVDVDLARSFELIKLAADQNHAGGITA